MSLASERTFGCPLGVTEIWYNAEGKMNCYTSDELRTINERLNTPWEGQRAMNVEFAYEIGQTVNVKPYKVSGKVIALQITSDGLYYRVRHLDGCLWCERWFRSWNLDSVQGGGVSL